MNRKILIIIIIVVLVVIGAVWTFNTNRAIAPENGIVQNGETDTEGWKIYIDDGLGFTFQYQSDWNLYPDPDTNVKKTRQEQIILEKDGARIRIDPLGRRGASSGPNPFEKEDIVINGISWSHIWTNIKTSDYYDYHRFTDSNDVLTLKDDPTTDGIVESTGQPYYYKDNFRVHVLLENEINEGRRIEAVNTAVKILETLTVL